MPTLGQLVWSADSARDSVRFDIAFVRPVFDSAGHVGMPTHTRDAVPFFSVLAPWEEHAKAKPQQTPPAYPLGARRQRYEGTVLLQFVVDSTGHPLMFTVHDLRPKGMPEWTRSDSSAYQSFLEETERGLARIEFIPARVGGCPVRQLVQMPFMYRLR